LVGVIRPVVQVLLRIMNPLSFVANTASRSLVVLIRLNLGKIPINVAAMTLMVYVVGLRDITSLIKS
jgi:hypothetical protein